MKIQSLRQYLEQSKEIKQNWAGLAKFCLYKSLSSGRKTGH